MRYWLAISGLGAAGWLARWLYVSYVRLTSVRLADGVYAVLGAGSNSLVVRAERDVFLIDTKFPPGSYLLRGWIARRVGLPVRSVVNTHYHYDHTFGNALFGSSTIYARAAVPRFMQAGDQAWWARHMAALPNEVVEGEPRRVPVGTREVQLHPVGPAHTHADVYCVVPAENVVATGDLVFHTFYPFFDLSTAGASLPGLVETVRTLADQYPSAIFVPGHGPLASADDLRRYAAYLEALASRAREAFAAGLSEDEAVRSIDLLGWGLRVLPSFHCQQPFVAEGPLSQAVPCLAWATAVSNIRSAYRLCAMGRG
jgi:glyoxylase-like metal-dependent hydrolase (beta-lactamase superfamily II)